MPAFENMLSLFWSFASGFWVSYVSWLISGGPWIELSSVIFLGFELYWSLVWVCYSWSFDFASPVILLLLILWGLYPPSFEISFFWFLFTFLSFSTSNGISQLSPIHPLSQFPSQVDYPSLHFPWTHKHFTGLWDFSEVYLIFFTSSSKSSFSVITSLLCSIEDSFPINVFSRASFTWSLSSLIICSVSDSSKTYIGNPLSLSFFSTINWAPFLSINNSIWTKSWAKIIFISADFSYWEISNKTVRWYSSSTYSFLLLYNFIGEIKVSLFTPSLIFKV